MGYYLDEYERRQYERIDALSYLRGYVSGGLSTIARHLSSRMATEDSRATVEQELAKLAELSRLPLDELVTWYRKQTSRT